MVKRIVRRWVLWFGAMLSVVQIPVQGRISVSEGANWAGKERLRMRRRLGRLGDLYGRIVTGDA
jgi:hypothetical protein